MMKKAYHNMIIEVIKDLEKWIQEGDKECAAYSLNVLKTVVRWQREEGGLYENMQILSRIYGLDEDTEIVEIRKHK